MRGTGGGWTPFLPVGTSGSGEVPKSSCLGPQELPLQPPGHRYVEGLSPEQPPPEHPWPRPCTSPLLCCSGCLEWCRSQDWGGGGIWMAVTRWGVGRTLHMGSDAGPRWAAGGPEGGQRGPQVGLGGGVEKRGTLRATHGCSFSVLFTCCLFLSLH